MSDAAGAVDPEVLRAVTVFSTCTPEQLARLLRSPPPQSTLRGTS